MMITTTEDLPRRLVGPMILPAILLVCLAASTFGQIVGRCEDPVESDGWCPTKGCYNNGDGCTPCKPCSPFSLTQTSLHPWQCRKLQLPNFCVEASGDPATELPPSPEIPQIIGNFSMNGDKWRVVFFNEVAADGGSVLNYARVGKICSKEWSKSESERTTYQKATILCESSDGTVFNHIADVISTMNQTNDWPLFYGIFSGERGESALCVYPHSKVQTGLTGKFADPASSVLEPMDLADVPDKNPGRCGGDNLTDWEIAFIRTHPLMYKPVEDKFFLFNATGNFTQITNHSTTSLDGRSYVVLFIATDDGRILKLVQLWDNTVNLVEEILVTPVPKEILDIQVTNSQSGPLLEVQWMEDTHSIPLHRCRNMSDSCACVQDPYCVWYEAEKSCQELGSEARGNKELAQSVETIRLCSRSHLNEPLLLTDFRRAPTTPGTSTLAPSTPAMTYTDGTRPPYKAVVDGSNGSYLMTISGLISAACLGFAAVSIACLVIRRIRRCPSPLLPQYAPHRITTTFNAIEVHPNCPMSVRGQWRIEPEDASPVIGKGIIGRVTKLVFPGLKPLTHYDVYLNDCKIDTFRTLGPQITVPEGSISKTSVEVQIASWEDQFQGLIRMENSSWGSREKAVICQDNKGAILLDGLLPNLEYTLQLRMGGSTVDIQKVKTKEESFWMEESGRVATLKWDISSTRFSHLHVHGCCLPNWREVCTQKGFLELGVLSEFEDLTVEVDAELPLGDHMIGSVTYNARPTEPSTPAVCDEDLTVLLSLRGFSRQSLAQIYTANESLFRTFCYTMDHGKDEADTYYLLKSVEDRCLMAWSEADEEFLRGKTLHALGLEFKKGFEAALSEKGREWAKGCGQFYEAVKATKELHGEEACGACDTLYRALKHRWKCVVSPRLIP